MARTHLFNYCTTSSWKRKDGSLANRCRKLLSQYIENHHQAESVLLVGLYKTWNMVWSTVIERLGFQPLCGMSDTILVGKTLVNMTKVLRELEKIVTLEKLKKTSTPKITSPTCMQSCKQYWFDMNWNKNRNQEKSRSAYRTMLKLRQGFDLKSGLLNVLHTQTYKKSS